MVLHAPTVATRLALDGLTISPAPNVLLSCPATHPPIRLLSARRSHSKAPRVIEVRQQGIRRHTSSPATFTHSSPASQPATARLPSCAWLVVLGSKTVTPSTLHLSIPLFSLSLSPLLPCLVPRLRRCLGSACRLSVFSRAPFRFPSTLAPSGRPDLGRCCVACSSRHSVVSPSGSKRKHRSKVRTEYLTQPINTLLAPTPNRHPPLRSHVGPRTTSYLPTYLPVQLLLQSCCTPFGAS